MSAEKDAGRNDARPMREWVESTPLDLAWVREQTACPGCGSVLDSVCFKGVTSMWCGRNRFHYVRPDRYVTSPGEGN
jgi:hypothetical protein